MRSVRVTFVVFGLFWGSWAVAALDVQNYLGLSDAGLGLLLSATVVGGAAANAFGGVLAERHGGRVMLPLALVIWAVSLLVLALTRGTVAFIGLFLVVVAFGGLVDVVMNVVGAAGTVGRSDKLLRLHALYNVGALTGAAAAGLLVDAGSSFRVLWGAIALLAAAVAVWVRRSELPAGTPGERHGLTEAMRAIRRQGLIVLAAVFAIGALVEGALSTWGVLFLRTELDVAAAAGAGAYAAGAALAITARLSMGWWARRFGERRIAQLGLGIAGAGLVVEATIGNVGVAAGGLALAALGSSVYWPLLLAHAAGHVERPAVIVGGLSTFGYIGFLTGAPLVGWVAQVVNLRAGLLVLAGVAIVGSLLRGTPVGAHPAPARR